MTRQYSPKRFFRQVSNRFLQQYFTEKNVLTDVNFTELSETEINPIYDAWLALSEEDKKSMEKDFQQIDEMSTEAGCKAIMDEANYHGENLAKQFASLKNFYDRAFWVFLERPHFWAGATAFYHADTRPTSYWRKRKNLPNMPAHVDDVSLQLFQSILGEYFYINQGRGKNCKVEVYKRGDLNYFFAYPENYAETNIEWEGNKFSRRHHHPAFEIIFVYSQKEHTLDICFQGGYKIMPDLQGIFATTILKTQELSPDEKDERVYDLSIFRSRNVRFLYRLESGIENVLVRKLRLKIQGQNTKITLETEPLHYPHTVYDLLDNFTSKLHPAQLDINQVGIKVTFIPASSNKKPKTRNFDITWPNSCSLKYDEQSLIIRKMLADSGIEPKVTQEADELVPC